MKEIGVCFGAYFPLHQGHMDLIMRAKKENDMCYVIVCAFGEEPQAAAAGLPLRERTALIRRTFLGDEQIRVAAINDLELGIDESKSEANWEIWLRRAGELMHYNPTDEDVRYNWYVAEPSYKSALDMKLADRAFPIDSCRLFEKVNHISSVDVRRNPLRYWNKIARPFRSFFSTNILITGTASEGKSTLTRDIATYFGLPYSEEYARTYMYETAKGDPDLTVDDFMEFLIGQKRDLMSKIEGPGNNGIVLSDTDNIVTLMYAQAYVDDENIDISEDDCRMLEDITRALQRRLKWDHIFLLPPKNEYVDDGLRYMAQSSSDERQKNYAKLVCLMKQFGLWDKVEILDGNFAGNYNRVKEYIEAKLS